ncbi:talin-1 isoform X2 [Leguminivora glycinivorella]|uniref:talin-1 isoform X2 n=1 Tax=Leguminivora glycinivorella TaxID=1035111 RepID=UPI00200D0F57|nr:talin-1 isoform X2 [Leguminivora glycinivorella]
MATLSLKISLEGGKVVKTIQFDPSTTIYDACRIIREKILEASSSDPKEYGLFLASEEDNKKGIWLEASRSLDYYMLRNGDILEYCRKTRNLRVRMLDGSVKTLLVDDSQIVANLMVVICTKIGITNYDEYGLVREELKEEPDPCEKPNFGTLTLKRKHQDKERDAKMDQLRKKLRTDDEVNWVEPAKTLREQGIDVTETLLLRRKLFFSDRNVDSRDPVQLNLLYVQARDAILDGTHPITQDKACEFAGIQCQIQFGDHKEDKHTTGFLDLKEFLPASYVKVKGTEKKVFKEHKRHAGLSELDAKVLYTKNARDLPTYGVAFFLVKEKMKGKNKLVPRLLGVTKDSVLRLDEKTKEILQTWPLTTVRRWCASPNTFTLDFGDYSDQYYSVQTTEAEQILQVIAGYIDIIVRKRRARDHLGIEGDEGSAMLEDSVSPSKANIIQHDTFKSGKVNTESVAKPAVMRPGAEGAKVFAVGHMTSAQQTTISGQVITGHTPPAASQVQQTRVTSIMSEPQRALLSTITTGRELIKHTEESLSRATLPSLGQDAASVKWKQVTMDTSKQVVTSQIAAMNAATAQVVTLTSGSTEEVDHTAVGAAITTITSNLPEMTKGVQMIAALMEDDDNGDRLLDATRKLCSAFSDLLKAAEPETKEPRQSLLNAASRVGEASTSVLHTIGDEEDKETQDILLSLAKAVANTTAALVLKAKNVAAQCRDEQPLQNSIIAAATHCALATSQLVACAKVVAPTLHNPQCREQLTSAARLVARAVEKLVDSCRAAEGVAPQNVEQLTAAAKRVSEELERLLQHCHTDRRAQPSVTERSVETVMTASERVVEAHDPAEMVRQARLLGQATAHLITNIKTEAEKQPSDAQRKLLAAAKLLADATARMVEAARQCATSPQDREKQENLRKAAEELRYITVDYAQGQDIVSSQMARLQETARHAASSATQLITSAHNAAQHNTNKYSQESLLQECEVLSEHIPRVVDAVQVAERRPDHAAARLDLIASADAFLQPSGHVLQAARAALPTVADAPTAKHLTHTTQQLTASCADLRSAVSRARISCKGLELDAAAEIIRSLQEELDELDEAARAFDLKPLPGQSAEWARSTMASASRAAAGSTAQLVSAARRQDPPGCGDAAAGLSAALRQWTGGVRAAAHADAQHTPRLTSTGREVLYSSLTLVETVKTYLSTSERVDISTIVTMAKDVTQNLDTSLEAVPSHSELHAAMENINETLNILNMGEFPPSDRTYGELQSELNAAAVGLNSASSEVVQGIESPSALAENSRHFGDAFNRLLGVGMEMAGQTEDRETQTLMVNSMKSVTINSSKLLTVAKSVSQDLTRPNAKNQLAAAARAVTESINRLVDVCTEAAPGQKECAAAIRSIEGSRVLLDAPSQPVSELSYFANVDACVAHSKALSEGMSSMATSVKRSEHTQFCRAVRNVADAVLGLVDCTAQAAYWVAVSDSTSVAGRPGLVDQAQFARAAVAIDQACQALADPTSDQQQVLSAATVIAKHTSALCNACRVASGKTTEPQAKRHFVQAAKDVANSTAALVKEIKALDSDYSEANRARCAAATGPLQEAVRSLCQFADSPQFSSVPARISPQARQSQQSILESGRSIISASCSMLESAKALAVTPDARPQWQSLATHSKTVSDSIKSLLGDIREKAPGQRECAAALETLGRQRRALDQAALQAVAQELPTMKTDSLQGYLEQIENSTTEMLERIEPVRVAAKGEAENLGHSVVQLVSYCEPLVSATIGAASNMTSSSSSGELMEHARTVLETLALVTHAASQAAGNPTALTAHRNVDQQSQLCRSALTELLECARTLSTERGAVGPLLDSLQRSVCKLTPSRLSLVGSFDETDSFVDYQTRMVGTAKEIARLATDMTAKAATDASRLVVLGNELCVKYEQLAQDSVGASATTPNADVANSIRVAVVELGEAAAELIKAGGACRLNSNTDARRLVADCSRKVSEKVVSVLAALQAGSRGTQACIDAAATIAAIIQDLDTTILFASAGTLHSEKENDTFSDHRENILKTAKTLVEDTKTLVGGAAGTQEQLAHAAQNSVTTIVQLCEVVKQGAMSLGSHSPEPQVLLLHAARDVCAALRDLAAATTAASGKQLKHPDCERLKHAAKRLTDKRRSLPTPRRRDYNSADSETDLFQSDQEDELIKLLDYSSQDDDVSPSVFHDNCEEIIAYIERLMKNPEKRKVDDDLNLRYNLAAKNSLVDMDWRVLKYGENILLGEVKTLVDLFIDYNERAENKRKRAVIMRLKANDDLDKEMKRLSQVIEDMDSEVDVKEVTKTIRSIQTFPRTNKVEKLKNPIFKVRKVRPVSLECKSPSPEKIFEVKSPTPDKIVEVKSPIHEKQNGFTEITVAPEMVAKDIKVIFQKMLNDDSEWWKAIAKKNLDKMEETRKELERFSGHELVLGDFQNEIDKYENEKKTLQTFIDDVDKSKAVNKDLEYDKKYEDMVLKLIEFAKKDFVYKGFDPLIEQLKALSNIQIEARKKKVHIQDIVNIYTQIDISKYTYEELCLLERYYKEIIRKYKEETYNKENIKRDDRSPSLCRDETQSAPPTFHRNVILNVHSSQNLTKNIKHYGSTIITNGDSLKRSQINYNNSKNNLEIFDLTRTYPEEYYANNWWSIYEDILKNREHQFGSIDNWWNFYEAILNKKDTSDEELKKIRAVVKYRNSLRKPSSRMEEQLKMLDGVKRQSFTESEDVATDNRESVMVTNVTSLLKTVKAVEDEHTRGTRALESTIEAISQEIEILMNPTPPKTTATPEELIRCTRQMTVSTAKAVSAGNSNKQDQLTAAANLGRKTVVDLLAACKAAAFTAETDELRIRTIESGREAALAYRALLQAVLSGNGKRQLPDLSRRVAAAVADIIAAADLLKGSDWVDPDDPTIIAENELLGAAASIDAAAKKLESLRPRKSMKVQEADESLNFDEMILEAAKSIITATSALVRAASAAQRELIDQGKVARRPTSSSDDGQWSEGLISAARLVAAAAHSLVEAANALVQGAGSEERLISSARQVASSTAQLLVACKVKADPSSESTRRLQAAGAEVIRSTDNLVRAARDAMHCEEERSLVLNRRMVGGIAQEIDARSEILRIEKELEEARGRLNAIRQAKYKMRGAETSGDETDTDVTLGRVPVRPRTPNSSYINTTYSPNSTYSAYNTNLSQHISQLDHSIHGQHPGYQYGQNIHPTSPGYNQSGQNIHPTSPGYTQGHGQNIHPTSPGYTQGQSIHPTSPGYGQTQGQTYSQTGQNYTQTHTQNIHPTSPGYNQNYNQNMSHTTHSSNGYSTLERKHDEKQYTVQSPTFSSFRPQEEAKQNYEGFTTRSMDETITVRSLQLPQVRTAVLVGPGPEPAYRREGDRIYYKREKPAPPPRRASLLNYETRLFDTPREQKTEEQRQYESNIFKKEFGYEQKMGPISPKFNARDLKFDDKEHIYSTLKKPANFDGVGQSFSEHQKSTEAIPGGTKQTEFSMKSESYQSYPKTEFIKTETKSPFVTSTPSKFEKSDYHQEFKQTSTDLVKAATPDYERISSPYGKEVHSYGGPNYMEETTTEVKEIPNGTQKVTTTKIYSSSPVNLTTTNTKYEPVKLEGIDELSKSFDNDSRYSTLDSRFNTLESKLSSDTSRSFMRPSEFQESHVVKKDLSKEIDNLDKKFSKSTISSETIEKKSVMTKSHKSETSSTVTKKFGNF